MMNQEKSESNCLQITAIKPTLEGLDEQTQTTFQFVKISHEISSNYLRLS